jgi:hypothetical protein
MKRTSSRDLSIDKNAEEIFVDVRKMGVYEERVGWVGWSEG